MNADCGACKKVPSPKITPIVSFRTTIYAEYGINFSKMRC